MAMFSTALSKARQAAPDAGKVACIRRLLDEDKLPKECRLPGDFDGTNPLGKLPHDTEKAARLIEAKLWEPQNYRLLEQEVADKLLTMAMDLGPAQAHRILQQALCSMGAQLEVTGVLDKATLRTAAHMGAKFTTGSVVAVMRAHQEGLYRQVAARAPELAEHLEAWIKHARS